MSNNKLISSRKPLIVLELISVRGNIIDNNKSFHLRSYLLSQHTGSKYYRHVKLLITKSQEQLIVVAPLPPPAPKWMNRLNCLLKLRCLLSKCNHKESACLEFTPV